MELGTEVQALEVVIEHQQEEHVGPSESVGEKDTKTEELEERIPIKVEEEREDEVKPPVTMNLSGGREGGSPPPPPLPLIDPLVRPRGLPIRVPHNLVPLDMPADLPKLYGTRDDNPSRHMKGRHPWRGILNE